MHVATVGGEEFLLFVEVVAVAGDHALRVEHQDILLLGTDGHIEFGAGNGGSTGTVHHDLHLGDVLADHLQCVLQSGSRDDGRTVLVVMHHGDVECALQAVFDVEALRSLDVLKVDTTESGGNLLHGLAELLGILFGHLNIEYIDATVDLEEQSLTFHHGFSAHSTDVAKTEYGGTVRDNGHEVTLVGVLEGSVGILLNFETGECHTR